MKRRGKSTFFSCQAVGDKATQFSFVRITDLEIGFPAGNGIRRLTDDSCQIRGARKIDAHFPSTQGQGLFCYFTFTLSLFPACQHNVEYNLKWSNWAYFISLK